MIVSWKSETDVDDGTEIGKKVFVYDEDDPDVDPLDEWMTREQAETLAREKGYDFEEQ